MLTKLLRNLGEVIKLAAITAIIVIPVRTFIAQPFIVSGASMDPTFKDQEYLIVDELSYYLRAPARGEVVVFRFPNDPSKHFIKRIIGLPGESVKIDEGNIFINDQKLTEPYLSGHTLAGSWSATLGPNDYYVLGDNRPVSLDSRAWGALPEKLITGRVLVRLFPFNRVGFLPGSVHD